MKILVFGAGTIGIYLGTKLFAHGHDVKLLGRNKLRKLEHDFIFINGEKYQLPERIYEVTPEHFDLVLVTTKLYDVSVAMKLIEDHFSSSIIACVQNGLVEERLYGVLINQPQFVVVSVFNGYNLQGNQLSVLESEKGLQIEDHQAGRKLFEILNQSNIPCFLNGQIHQSKARKFIANLALNALSAVENKTVGELVTSTRLKAMVDGLIEESWQVLVKDYDLPSLEIMQDEIYQLIFQVNNHYSSMCQDLQAGKKTEIEFLNGTIVKLGKEQGIATPLNQQMYEQIQDKTLHNLH